MIDPREAVTVPAWHPVINVSEAVSSDSRIEQFAARACAGYEAVPIVFSEPEEVTISGRHFAAISRRSGLIEASVHTIPRFRWRQAFESIQRTAFCDQNRVLVSASAGHGNYYHWISETIAAALMYRTMLGGEVIPLVVPALDNGWQREALATLGIDNPLLEVSSDEALVCQGGVLTSLIGPSHPFAPHPAVLAMMQGQRRLEEGRRSDELLLYVSRLDAGQRRLMLNEHELCSTLAGLGFRIITASSLSVADQIALFRKAKVIVSPHGAALSNLLFAADGHDGPIVVELFQENYLNRCFLKMCQGKRLLYHAVINKICRHDAHHHQSEWMADVSLIVRTIEPILHEF